MARVTRFEPRYPKFSASLHQPLHCNAENTACVSNFLMLK